MQYQMKNGVKIEGDTEAAVVDQIMAQWFTPPTRETLYKVTNAVAAKILEVFEPAVDDKSYLQLMVALNELKGPLPTDEVE